MTDAEELAKLNAFVERVRERSGHHHCQETMADAMNDGPDGCFAASVKFHEAMRTELDDLLKTLDAPTAPPIAVGDTVEVTKDDAPNRQGVVGCRGVVTKLGEGGRWYMIGAEAHVDFDRTAYPQAPVWAWLPVAWLKKIEPKT